MRKTTPVSAQRREINIEEDVIVGEQRMMAESTMEAEFQKTEVEIVEPQTFLTKR